MALQHKHPLPLQVLPGAYPVKSRQSAEPNGCQELKFSYVGMETKTAKITGLTHINVSLASTAIKGDTLLITGENVFSIVKNKTDKQDKLFVL